ncbi:hypothetical protein PCE1_003629 [Barthelona sp. PCE]
MESVETYDEKEFYGVISTLPNCDVPSQMISGFFTQSKKLEVIFIRQTLLELYEVSETELVLILKIPIFAEIRAYKVYRPDWARYDFLALSDISNRGCALSFREKGRVREEFSFTFPKVASSTLSTNNVIAVNSNGTRLLFLFGSSDWHVVHHDGNRYQTFSTMITPNYTDAYFIDNHNIAALRKPDYPGDDVLYAIRASAKAERLSRQPISIINLSVANMPRSVFKAFRHMNWIFYISKSTIYYCDASEDKLLSVRVFDDNTAISTRLGLLGGGEFEPLIIDETKFILPNLNQLIFCSMQHNHLTFISLSLSIDLSSIAYVGEGRCFAGFVDGGTEFLQLSLERASVDTLSRKQCIGGLSSIASLGNGKFCVLCGVHHNIIKLLSHQHQAVPIEDSITFGSRIPYCMFTPATDSVAVLSQDGSDNVVIDFLTEGERETFAVDGPVANVAQCAGNMYFVQESSITNGDDTVCEWQGICTASASTDSAIYVTTAFDLIVYDGEERKKNFGFNRGITHLCLHNNLIIIVDGDSIGYILDGDTLDICKTFSFAELLDQEIFFTLFQLVSVEDSVIVTLTDNTVARLVVTRDGVECQKKNQTDQLIRFCRDTAFVLSGDDLFFFDAVALQTVRRIGAKTESSIIDCCRVGDKLFILDSSGTVFTVQKECNLVLDDLQRTNEITHSEGYTTLAKLSDDYVAMGRDNTLIIRDRFLKKTVDSLSFEEGFIVTNVSYDPENKIITVCAAEMDTNSAEFVLPTAGMFSSYIIRNGRLSRALTKISKPEGCFFSYCDGSNAIIAWPSAVELYSYDEYGKFRLLNSNPNWGIVADIKPAGIPGCYYVCDIIEGVVLLRLTLSSSERCVRYIGGSMPTRLHLLKGYLVVFDAMGGLFVLKREELRALKSHSLQSVASIHLGSTSISSIPYTTLSGEECLLTCLKNGSLIRLHHISNEEYEMLFKLEKALKEMVPRYGFNYDKYRATIMDGNGNILDMCLLRQFETLNDVEQNVIVTEFVGCELEELIHLIEKYNRQ